MWFREHCSNFWSIFLLCQGSLVWLSRTEAQRNEYSKVLQHFHFIPFPQLFPHSSLYTYTYYPKALSQYSWAWIIVKQCSSIIYQILYPFQQVGSSWGSQEMCYLLQSNGRLDRGRLKKRMLKTLLVLDCSTWKHSETHSKTCQGTHWLTLESRTGKMWDKINWVWGKNLNWSDVRRA